MTSQYSPLPLPAGVTESYLPSHDLTYHVLSAGQPGKPLIVLLHGFPELAFSWRKIMPAIAEEGYYVVAYDQRGYGRTTGWDTREYADVDLNTFTFIKCVRDAVILVNALGYTEVACVIGHDFGGVASSMCALMRPDIFKSVIMMSHPFRGSPPLPFNTVNQPPKPSAPAMDILKALTELLEPRKHYNKSYFATDIAAREMDNPKEDLHQFLRDYFHLKSGDWKGNDPQPLKSWAPTELAKMPYYYIMPLHSSMREAVVLSMKSTNEDPSTVSKLGSRWLPDEDLAVYVEEWGRNGFQGGLNWYRVSTSPVHMRDLELFAGRKIDVPALYVAGVKDWGTYQEPGAVENMGRTCSKFEGVKLVEGAGHWVQQEQPEKLVEVIKEFLKDVKVEAISY